MDTGIHTSIADRAAAARSLMLQRDRADKEQLRELRKEKRQQKRVSGWLADGAVPVPGWDHCTPHPPLCCPWSHR